MTEATITDTTISPRTRESGTLPKNSKRYMMVRSLVEALKAISFHLSFRSIPAVSVQGLNANTLNQLVLRSNKDHSVNDM